MAGRRSRAYAAYAAARAKGKHVEPKPGDRLPLKGVDAVVGELRGGDAAAAGRRRGRGQPGMRAGGAARAGAAREPALDRRPPARSAGSAFVDLGDLSGAPLFALVCPKSLLGPIDLYLVPHHGGADAAVSRDVRRGQAARRDRQQRRDEGRCAGSVRGAAQPVSASTCWQLHRSRIPGAQNFADERIANLDESTAHWIKVSARDDGSFIVTNGRTGASKSFDAAAPLDQAEPRAQPLASWRSSLRRRHEPPH